jgi:hypothetical protein
MKEIRTIKMVEVTEVKFVANDGKEFTGNNAERDCRDYERTSDRNRVESAFKRINFVPIDAPLIDWLDSEQGLHKVYLADRSDYVAMMDYFNVFWDVFENRIEEPTEYPYSMIVYSYNDGVCEYKRDLKADLMQMLAQLD